MKLGIVVGSVREGRVSDRLAKWVAQEASSLDGTEVSIIDLIDYPMPMFNESISPQYNPNRQPEPIVGKFLDSLADRDAVVLITPEYNRSYSSVLKNAIDYIDFQLKHKPVLIVAHGSTGGAQAVGHLRGVIPALGAVSNPAAVMIVGQLSQVLDEAGNLSEQAKANPYGPAASLANALNDLKWYSDALAEARSADS